MTEADRQQILNEVRNDLMQCQLKMRRIAEADMRHHSAKRGSIKTRDRVGVVRLAYAQELKLLARQIGSMKI
ncbi:hypothetical protein RUESEDTHA_00756 [Ruegeria sp. THAF57]|uniref:hypothetical protein n=1 Tax=unclassified Ruegeria TaxID=2625375 RepID=UPI00148A0C0C|nr:MULTISPECIES: hypothetical protein [unclassified Ruegeria]CAD0183880.1 hypothetical protein RUESEDTHA_00756 [Ruegeria sp. THAF57]